MSRDEGISDLEVRIGCHPLAILSFTFNWISRMTVSDLPAKEQEDLRVIIQTYFI